MGSRVTGTAVPIDWEARTGGRTADGPAREAERSPALRLRGRAHLLAQPTSTVTSTSTGEPSGSSATPTEVRA